MSHHFTPRLMQAKAAAHYLGISTGKLRTLNLPRKVLGGNRMYDVRDLDRFADQLSYEGQPETDNAVRKWFAENGVDVDAHPSGPQPW